VAGSSVFPTAGAAPPTLTIVAMALRLASHLRRNLGVSPPPARREIATSVPDSPFERVKESALVSRNRGWAWPRGTRPLGQ
ncbi:MAG TPA: GMC family oxidoreductase, partial [Burkholderiales bacterium]|nr:GMC family oxidoreductase [Burkholderiales bacterium]